MDNIPTPVLEKTPVPMNEPCKDKLPAAFDPIVQGNYWYDRHLEAVDESPLAST